jgi:hypothetical protein
MIEFIKENISWLKDIFTLIFVGVGSVVAILTYRRARATILQPIRTEVIKKQSEILSRLLQILKDNNQSFEVGLDYMFLVQVNVLLTLKDYGFIFKGQEEIAYIKENINGWIPCGKSNVLNEVEIIGVFEEKTNPVYTKENGAKKFDNLKKGEIDLEKIYITNKHSEFVKLITEFRDDPFMPTSIQMTLTELTNDINNNLTMILKGELEAFMLNFSKTYFQDNTAPPFKPIGVYNDFNHSRVHHRQTLIKLKNEIRKYLRIEEGW